MCITTGTVESYRGLLVCRFFLGLCEGYYNWVFDLFWKIDRAVGLQVVYCQDWCCTCLCSTQDNVCIGGSFAHVLQHSGG